MSPDSAVSSCRQFRYVIECLRIVTPYARPIDPRTPDPQVREPVTRHAPTPRSRPYTESYPHTYTHVHVHVPAPAGWLHGVSEPAGLRFYIRTSPVASLHLSSHHFTWVLDRLTDADDRYCRQTGQLTDRHDVALARAALGQVTRQKDKRCNHTRCPIAALMPLHPRHVR